MALIKNGIIADDPWLSVGDDQPVPEEGPVVVSLTRWRAEAEALGARSGPVGVRLAPGQEPDEIANDLKALAMIELEFPVFRDGRAFSHARVLRERYGYVGELRAVGDILYDQFMFLHRCGFDAVEVVSEKLAREWQKALEEIGVWYQPTGDGRATANELRHRSVDG